VAELPNTHSTVPTAPPLLFYSVAEFVRTTGTGQRTVRRWIADGRVRTVKLGRLVKIPVSEIGRIGRDGIAAPESSVARFEACEEARAARC
jgi:excisionase family DNA binding protein